MTRFSKLCRRVSVAGISAVLVVVPASAGVILQPVAATTNMGSFSSQYLPTFAVDQSGLVTGGYTSGVTDFDAYVASANVCSSSATCEGGSSFNIWFSQAGVTTGNFDLDLGSSQLVQSLALWNDPQAAGQGVNAFQLFASDDAGFASAVSLGAFTALEGAVGDFRESAQVYAFAPVTARYFRIQIDSNHGSTFTTGISEIAFERGDITAAVPEPTTWAMMIAGFGLVGGALRTRARRSVRFA